MVEQVPESIRRKYAPARRRAIVQALKDGNTLAAAAAAGGITSQLMWKWRNALPEFDEECREAEFFFERRAVQYLVNQMEGGNLSAVLFWLERRRKEDWGRRDYSLDNVTPTRITVIEAVPPASLAPGQTSMHETDALAVPATIEGEYTYASSNAGDPTTRDTEMPSCDPDSSHASRAPAFLRDTPDTRGFDDNDTYATSRADTSSDAPPHSAASSDRAGYSGHFDTDRAGTPDSTDPSWGPTPGFDSDDDATSGLADESTDPPF